MQKSFLSYLGGKSLLANKIIPLIPDHRCYCEVFAGANWLLFKKESSKVEIINDINGELVTLYRIVKNHLDEFIRYFRWVVVARDEFDRFLREDAENLTDIQRAARYYYLLKSCYGARMTSPSFGIVTMRGPRLNLLRIEEDLSAAHIRLSGVSIENRPYAALIKQFDRPHTFFYIDPPYWGNESDYGKGIFKREDFTRLNDILRAIKGRFILSINDRPETRKLSSTFKIKQVSTTYSVGTGGGKRAKELLIMNYK